MIGGVQVIGQRKGALSITVERLVPGGRHDPVVPTHVAEVDIQRVSPAVAIALSTPLLGAALCPARQRVTFAIVTKRDQKGAKLVPVFAWNWVQGAAYAHVAPLLAGRLVQVQNLHSKAVVGELIAGPAQYGRAHVEAFPVGRVVTHQSGVQKLRDDLPSPWRLQHLVNVYAMETLVSCVPGI